MTNTDANVEELNDLVLDSDTGGRRPEGFTLKLSLTVALVWSLFQLWVASPLPYLAAEYIPFFKKLLLDGTKTRYIHLAFAMFLVYVSYPANARSPRNRVTLLDWIFLTFSVFSCLYLLLNYEALSQRAGAATSFDVFISIGGILLLLEATRRALGPPLAIIASIFLIYAYAGPYMPDVLMHKGHNLTKIASHQWLATEGVFGIAIGVSAGFVFLFVLFGSLLEKAGAGNYFIKVAFSMLGHMKGGPAKAAVLSSGMTGLISGSSIANVVTTGTFTIPLMKKVGFSSEKAGSVEVAASVNGQIMPPVMGAAAFLMVEYIGIPYVDVIRHAFIPAVISYIALLYIVHLEALKYNMKTLPKRGVSTVKSALLRAGIIITSMVVISGVFYYLFSFIKHVLGDYSIYIIGLIISAIYLWLISIRAKLPDLENDIDKEITELPEVGPTVKSGLHFLLPIAVLIWCLMVERLSPGLSAFWATVIMMVIIVTQRPITSFFRNAKKYKQEFDAGLSDLYDGLVTGAKNMAGIGVATAAAGIIVGVVTQTGVGNKMTEMVSIVAGNSVLLMLILTAIICIILGMGLPTTANYIVVSSLMATVVVELGKQNGLIIPLVAVHFFVFYFGIMADVTPPVGLASFAAAAVSGGDPIKTSFQAFIYSMRTMILPFLFVFDNQMLLIGVDPVLGSIFLASTIIFLKSTVAILVFTAATQGYFIIKSQLKESIILGLVAFSLFLPNFWINRYVPEYQEFAPKEIYNVVKNAQPKEKIAFQVKGEDFLGDEKLFFVNVNFSKNGSAVEKLSSYGLSLYEAHDKILVSNTRFASQAEKDGFSFDFEIINVKKKQEQPSKYYVYIPAWIALFAVYFRQRKRKIITA
jgi:TRAP transporter 4TM/12TM fusion protein